MTRTIQWLNENRYRNYPFVEDHVPEYGALASGIMLPETLLLDLQYIAYRAIDPADSSLRLAEVQASALFDTLTLRFELGTTTMTDIVLPRTISTAPSVVSHDGIRLEVVCGAEGVNTVLDELESAGDTSAYTSSTYDHFEPALCIIQDKHRVNSLVGTATGSTPITGDIYLEEGYNTRILVHEGTQRVSILAEPGAGLGRYCDRTDPLRVGCDALLLALNELYADGYGRFQLRGANGVTVLAEPEHNRITVKTNITSDDVDCGAANV
jgi:hypothetical protein